MTGPGEDSWLDGDAGRLVRPYTVSNGRTSPSTRLDLVSMVMTAGDPDISHLGPEHVLVVTMCRHPVSVAEVAARLRLPAVVTKVLLSDLIDCGAIVTQVAGRASDPADLLLLERVLDGLQRRL
jgi:Protein of unknown function (DUF742)